MVTLYFFIFALNMFLVQFNHSVLSDSFQSNELQHARPPCPSPTPKGYPNSCPLSPWCYPTFSSSINPFSFCPQSFQESGSFQMSQVAKVLWVLPMNTQDWYPLGWTGWIALQSKGLSRVFSNTRVQSTSSSVLSFLYSPTLTSIHDYWKNQ